MTTDSDQETPESIDPDEIEVEMNYEPDPTDLVLSSVPGGELFDPRKHKFTDDELKPQPMIKKARKVLVPEEQKVCWEKDEGHNSPADTLHWLLFFLDAVTFEKASICKNRLRLQG